LSAGSFYSSFCSPGSILSRFPLYKCRTVVSATHGFFLLSFSPLQSPSVIVFLCFPCPLPPLKRFCKNHRRFNVSRAGGPSSSPIFWIRFRTRSSNISYPQLSSGDQDFFQYLSPGFHPRPPNLNASRMVSLGLARLSPPHPPRSRIPLIHVPSISPNCLPPLSLRGIYSLPDELLFPPHPASPLCLRVSSFQQTSLFFLRDPSHVPIGQKVEISCDFPS